MQLSGLNVRPEAPCAEGFMLRRHIFGISTIVVSAVAISACSSGGGSSNNNNNLANMCASLGPNNPQYYSNGCNNLNAAGINRPNIQPNVPNAGNILQQFQSQVAMAQSDAARAEEQLRLEHRRRRR